MDNVCDWIPARMFRQRCWVRRRAVYEYIKSYVQTRQL